MECHRFTSLCLSVPVVKAVFNPLINSCLLFSLCIKLTRTCQSIPLYEAWNNQKIVINCTTLHTLQSVKQPLYLVSLWTFTPHKLRLRPHQQVLRCDGRPSCVHIRGGACLVCQDSVSQLALRPIILLSRLIRSCDSFLSLREGRVIVRQAFTRFPLHIWPLFPLPLIASGQCGSTTLRCLLVHTVDVLLRQLPYISNIGCMSR